MDRTDSAYPTADASPATPTPTAIAIAIATAAAVDERPTCCDPTSADDAAARVA